jgi:hypothetical protein
VTTLVQRERSVRSAALVAGLWGVGHALAFALAGSVIVLAGAAVPGWLRLSLELAAAGTLVAVGHQAIRDGRAGGDAPRSEVHRHGDYVHRHRIRDGGHGHGEAETPVARLDGLFHRLGPYRALRPVVVGGVHGLAGSATTSLLVLGAIASPVWAIVYLALFAVATIAGMLTFTIAVGAPIARITPRAGLVSGVASVVVGLLFAYRIVATAGLFAG